MPSDPVSVALVKSVGEEATKETKSLVSKILGPPAEEIGETLRLAIRAKLSPLRTKFLTANEAAEVALEAATRRLRNVDPAVLRSPAPEVFAGVIEGLQTRSEVPELREMFGALLATSMRSDVEAPHPSFTEVIRQIVPDEARLILYIAGHVRKSRKPIEIGHWTVPTAKQRRLFVGRDPSPDIAIAAGAVELANRAALSQPARAAAYVDNLCRLGVTDIERTLPDSAADDKLLYARLMANAHAYLRLTAFGRQFAAACLPENGSGAPSDTEDAVNEAAIGR